MYTQNKIPSVSYTCRANSHGELIRQAARRTGHVRSYEHDWLRGDLLLRHGAQGLARVVQAELDGDKIFELQTLAGKRTRWPLLGLCQQLRVMCVYMHVRAHNW